MCSDGLHRRSQTGLDCETTLIEECHAASPVVVACPEWNLLLVSVMQPVNLVAKSTCTYIPRRWNRGAPSDTGMASWQHL